MIQRNWIIVVSILILSILFPYENKFSYSSGVKKISLLHSPQFTEINGGYTRLTKMGDGYTTEIGMPELPQFTTYFQLDPSKNYDFQFEKMLEKNHQN